MYISRLISLVTAYDLDPAIPGAYVSALVVLVFYKTKNEGRAFWSTMALWSNLMP